VKIKTKKIGAYEIMKWYLKKKMKQALFSTFKFGKEATKRKQKHKIQTFSKDKFIIFQIEKSNKFTLPIDF